MAEHGRCLICSGVVHVGFDGDEEPRWESGPEAGATVFFIHGRCRGAVYARFDRRAHGLGDRRVLDEGRLMLLSRYWDLEGADWRERKRLMRLWGWKWGGVGDGRVSYTSALGDSPKR